MIKIITKQHKIILSVVILISLFFSYFYINQTFYDHIYIYFNQDDPEIVYYKQFQEIYGNEELGLIVFKTEDIFQNEYLSIINNITQMLENMPGIQRTFSITKAEEAVGIDDEISFQTIIPEGYLSEKNLKNVKNNVLKHAVLVNNLISKDATTTAVMIEFGSVLSNDEKGVILSKIKQKANAIADNRVDLRYSGIPFLEHEMNILTRHDNAKFTPVILLIIFIIVALLLKNATLSFLCMVNILLVSIWGIGFLTLCGESINMVTVIIAPVLLAVSVADSVHILSHYKEIFLNNGYDHKSSIRIVIKDLWKPCLLTSLTTAAGFASFITSDIRPVVIVGIFIAIGVMIAFALTIIFLPAGMMLFKSIYKPSEKDRYISGLKDSHQQKNDLFSKILTRIAHFNIAHYKLIFICFFIFVVMSFIGIKEMSYETNFANYLPDDNKIKMDINFIEKNLFGTVPIVLLIKANKKENDFTHSASLKLIDDLQSSLMKVMSDSFTSSFSVADYLKEINRAFNAGDENYFTIPENDLDIIDYYEIGNDDTLNRIISSDKMETRISFNSHLTSNKNSTIISEFLKKFVKEKFKDKFSYRFTGMSTLYVVMDENLRSSQYKSFVSALLVISLMMFFICKKKKLTAISIVPNLFPIIATFGVMGWFKIPLDVTTVMIASVTIGIAVDDTIHYLVWYRRNILSNLSIEASVVKTSLDVGKPIALTSLVLCLGFLVLCLGSVIPMRLFGLLTCLSIFFAFVGDLVVLPALLICFKPKVA